MSGATLDEQIAYVAVLVEAREITAVGAVPILRQATGRAMSRTMCLRLILAALTRRARARAADQTFLPDGWW